MTADLIIFNGIVQPMNDTVVAEAVAVIGDRIVAVGSTVEILALAGARTRLIDAKHRLVLPGFNDSHVHVLMGGFNLSQVELREAKSPEQFIAGLERFVQAVPMGQWIQGGNWDHESWPGAPLPTREWIDAVTPQHPVFVRRLDGHMALANSLALQLAGVNRATPEVAAGKIVRDEHGEPTGLLKDAAMDYLYKIIPEPNFEQRLAAARRASEYASSLGVTSVQDMSGGRDIDVFQVLLERGELKTRIYAMTPLAEWQSLANIGIRASFGSDMLRIGGLKAFSDGSLGSSTALFFEPYLNQPDTCGLPGPDLVPQGVMLKRVLAADRLGLQVMVHAIGDRANHEMLNIFQKVAETNGPRDRRFRIEHAQHLQPGEIPRFARQGVIASMQPYHAIDDGRWCQSYLGVERCRGAYAMRSLMNSGARLAFGSDWPIAPLNPMTGIYAAVTRRTLDGKNPGGWFPQEKLKIMDALRGYTTGAAYAEFMESRKSAIAPGKLADLVILDQDLFTISAADILDAKVMTTIVGGKVVYEKE